MRVLVRILKVLGVLAMPVIVPLAILTSWIWAPLLMLWLDSKDT